MLSTYKKSHLEQKISAYIIKNPKVITFGFWKKRPIFLTKYLDANTEKIDATRRLRLFSQFLKDIKTLSPEQIHQHTTTEFELIFTGYRAHIREEFLQKDRKLFLISTFEKEKK